MNLTETLVMAHADHPEMFFAGLVVGAGLATMFYIHEKLKDRAVRIKEEREQSRKK